MYVFKAAELEWISVYVWVWGRKGRGGCGSIDLVINQACDVSPLPPYASLLPVSFPIPHYRH